MKLHVFCIFDQPAHSQNTCFLFGPTSLLLISHFFLFTYTSSFFNHCLNFTSLSPTCSITSEYSSSIFCTPQSLHSLSRQLFFGGLLSSYSTGLCLTVLFSFFSNEEICFSLLHLKHQFSDLSY